VEGSYVEHSPLKCEEVIIDLLFPGNFQIKHTLEETIKRVEQVLEISEKQRSRTLIRIDSGGGSYEKIKWMLERGYQILTKENNRKAEFYSHGVKKWFADQKHPGRELGWLTVDMEDFSRPVKRLVIRFPEHKSGKMKHHCLITTLEPDDIIDLLKLPNETINNEKELALAYARLYDLRGGTVEIEIKESKQGIGINKRSKKRFEAQKMVMLLNSLAHNVLVWTRRWLTETDSEHKIKFARFGALRLVRDVFHTQGMLKFNPDGQLFGIVLNRGAPLAADLVVALMQMLAPARIFVSLGDI
jgi:hypothetical protein